MCAGNFFQNPIYPHSKPESIFDLLITTTTDSIYDSTIKLYVTSILEISPWKVGFIIFYYILVQKYHVGYNIKVRKILSLYIYKILTHWSYSSLWVRFRQPSNTTRYVFRTQSGFYKPINIVIALCSSILLLVSK